MLILLALLTILMVGCSNEEPFTSTASDIKVLEKGNSDDYKEAWILVIDPNSLEDEEFKVIVENPMVWNLIEVGKNYASGYHQEGNNNWILKQIHNIGDEDTLR